MSKYIYRGISVFCLVFGVAVSVAYATIGDFGVVFWICSVSAVIWIASFVAIGLK